MSNTKQGFEVGERLKRLRKEIRSTAETKEEKQRFTQAGVAAHLGICKEQYCNIENGKAQLTIEQLYLVCKFFNVSADYVVGLSDKQQHPDNDAFVQVTMQTISSLQEGLLNELKWKFKEIEIATRNYQKSIPKEFEDLVEHLNKLNTTK